MAEIYSGLWDTLRRPAVAEVALDLLLCLVPIWAAVMIGMTIGWSWRPRWTGLLFLGLRSRLRFLWASAPPGFGARRLWLAFTALSAFSLCRRLWSSFRVKAAAPPAPNGGAPESASDADQSLSCSAFEDENGIVTEKDLDHLLHLLDSKDVDSSWQNLMEKTTNNLQYQAWRREPEVGPIMYCSRTIFEDATPELVRDFFWDDDFRRKWDPMLMYFKALEEFCRTGTMIVHWIKKFPFFCSDREYIIGRRIWESGKTYYCVTKGVPHPSLPRKEKPRRVELYFSSWRIRAVNSTRQDSQATACEVTLIHYEDMGIPKDVAKVGVRHGMWGAVRKLQSGFRQYQLMRKNENALSPCALMARITTKISLEGAGSVVKPDQPGTSEEPVDGAGDQQVGVHQGLDWKWIIIGGAVAAVFVLNTGVVGKAVLLGAARRQVR